MKIVYECSLLQQVLHKHAVMPISYVDCDDGEFEDMKHEAKGMEGFSPGHQWFSVAGVTFYRSGVGNE